jgi:hypothetical protein
MNTKSHFFTRFIAAPVAAAGILGGAAMGLAAAANADPGPSDHSGGHSSEYRHDSRDSHRDFRPYFWDFWGWHHWDRSYDWHRS